MKVSTTSTKISLSRQTRCLFIPTLLGTSALLLPLLSSRAADTQATASKVGKGAAIRFQPGKDGSVDELRKALKAQGLDDQTTEKIVKDLSEKMKADEANTKSKDDGKSSDETSKAPGVTILGPTSQIVSVSVDIKQSIVGCTDEDGNELDPADVLSEDSEQAVDKETINRTIDEVKEYLRTHGLDDQQIENTPITVNGQLVNGQSAEQSEKQPNAVASDKPQSDESDEFDESDE